MPYSMQLKDHIPDDSPRMGRKVLLLPIIPVPSFTSNINDGINESERSLAYMLAVLIYARIFNDVFILLIGQKADELLTSKIENYVEEKDSWVIADNMISRSCLTITNTH